MRSARNFLIICDDTHRLMLLLSVLHRVFPNSVVQTYRQAEPALEAVRRHVFDAIIACRATDSDAILLIKELRRVTPAPILSIADASDGEKVLAAGATQFLDSERWLLTGKIVADMIGADRAVM